MENFKTSSLGIKLIEHYKSLMKVLSDGKIGAYKCPAGVWTIGWESNSNLNSEQ